MRRSLIVPVLITGAQLMTLTARPGSPISVEKLAATADAIVIARLEAAVQVGSEASGTLRVDRTLKGSVVPGSLLQVSWFSGEVVTGRWEIPVLEGLWFLSVDDHGQVSVLPRDNVEPYVTDMFLPVSRSVPPRGFEYSDAAAPLEKVMLELAATLEVQQQNPSPTLVFQLTFVRPSAGGAVFRRLAEAPGPTVRALGLAGLIKGGDISALERLEKEIAELVQTPAVLSLALAVEGYRDTRPEAIAVLGRLATSQVPEYARVAKAAAAVLRAIHTKETLPFLAALLERSDPVVRALAVSGFSSFAMNLPAETLENHANMTWLTPAAKSQLLTEDTKAHIFIGLELPEERAEAIVRFWQGWWLQNQAQLQ